MPDRWEAPAKVNLGLRVRPRDPAGYHPVVSLVQTIQLVDTLEVETAEEDLLLVDGEIREGRDDLVWRAVDELTAGRERPRLRWRLTKRIPVAAGLGGGSSDAAAALRATLAVTGWPDDPHPIAGRIGMDVAFFLVGGTAWMEGYGERITRIEPLRGFALTVVVPPFELRTEAVYRAWDELDEPEGPPVGDRDLPPALRAYGPLRNDLTPAAVALRPELGDWIDELRHRWDRPVLLSGSGPALFSFFADLDEAASAAEVVPAGTRFAEPAALRSEGVTRRPDDR
ncbi:MAG: 4-diphosphocytidyl-2-C-methyl-D-erythritol kinase [Acidimicrobiia bacterium]|nr:MAG: 4-diphosphocytidyl-2-C-methyl-D-erythritol kinase [Acidimicrobiia bacterium]